MPRGRYATQLAVELRLSLPGLCVRVTPVYDMAPGEEGSPGSFELLWEGDDWNHTKRLASRLATGALPTIRPTVRAVLQHLLGPAAAPTALTDMQNALLIHAAAPRAASALRPEDGPPPTPSSPAKARAAITDGSGGLAAFGRPISRSGTLSPMSAMRDLPYKGRGSRTFTPSTSAPALHRPRSRQSLSRRSLRPASPLLPPPRTPPIPKLGPIKREMTKPWLFQPLARSHVYTPTFQVRTLYEGFATALDADPETVSVGPARAAVTEWARAERARLLKAAHAQQQVARERAAAVREGARGRGKRGGGGARGREEERPPTAP